MDFDVRVIIAKIAFGLMMAVIIFSIAARADLCGQERIMRSGTVCDKQIVQHMFSDDKEYVITISEPAEGLLAKLYFTDAKVDYSVSPEIYSKYQVGDKFDSTAEIW